MQEHFVKGVRQWDVAFYLKQCATFKGETSSQQVVDSGHQVLFANSGQEAQVTKVYTKYGWERLGVAAVHKLYGTEQCTVAADGEKVVAAVHAVAVVHDGGFYLLGLEDVNERLK